MASAYSILRDYGDYIQPYDFNLITKGLEYKQSKYDANAAKIQQEIDSLTNLDLYRDVDKQYLYQKIKRVTELINATPHLDLSENGVVNSIHARVSDVVDDKVMNAYMGTQAVRNYFQTVKNIKEKHPKQYSARNDAYGRQPILEWLANNEVGEEFKGTEYIPFSDVRGKMVETLKEFYKDSKSTIEVPEIVDGKPTGRMIRKEFKGLSPDEVASIFAMQLDANDQKQLEIDAWASFERNPEQTVQTFKTYTDKRLDELHNELKLAKKNGETDKIAYYESAIDNFKTTTQNMLDSGDIKGISNYMQKEVVLGDLKNAFRKRRVSLEYKEDAVYWKGLNYSLNKAKYLLEVEKYKDKKDKKATETGNVFGIDTGVSEDIVRDNIKETKSKKQVFYEYGDKLEQNTMYYTNKVLDSVLLDQKDSIIQEAKDLVESEKGITYNQALMTIVNNKLNNLPPDDITVNFKTHYKQYRNFVETVGKIHNDVIKDISVTFDDRIKHLYDYNNGDILKKYSKVLGKDYTNTKYENLTVDDKKKLKQMMMLDLIKAKLKKHDVSIIKNAEAGDRSKVKGTIFDLIEAYNNEFGGNLSISDTRKFKTSKEVTGSTTKVLVGGRLGLIGEDNETNMLIKKADENNLGDDNWFLGNASIYNDNDIMNNLKDKDIDKRYDNLIDDSIIANIGKKMVSFNPIVNDKGQQKQTIYQRAIRNAIGKALNDDDTEYSNDGSSYSFYKGIDTEYKTKISSRLSKDDKSTVSIIWDSGVDGKAEIRVGGEKFLVRKDLVANELRKVNIQFDEQGMVNSSLFVVENGESIEPVKYIDKDKKLKNKEFYARNLNGMDFVLDKETSLLTLFDKYPTINEKAKNAIVTMYYHSDKLKTRVSIDKGNVSIDILNPENKVVYTKVYNRSQFGNIKKAQQYYQDAVRTQVIAPSFWVYKMFDDVLAKEVAKDYSGYRLADLYRNMFGNQTNQQ